jgi:hypothetical protein
MIFTGSSPDRPAEIRNTGNFKRKEIIMQDMMNKKKQMASLNRHRKISYLFERLLEWWIGGNHA